MNNSEKISLRKRIRSIIIIGLCLAFSSIGFTQDCYGTWLRSYEESTAVYIKDIERCTGSSAYILYQPFANSMCRIEANYNYDKALNVAAETYERCVKR